MPRHYTVLRKQGKSKIPLLFIAFLLCFSSTLLLSFKKPQEKKRCTEDSTESYCPQPHKCVDIVPGGDTPRPLIVVAAGAPRSASTFLFNALRILLRIRDPNTVSGWYADLEHMYNQYAQIMPRDNTSITDIRHGNRLEAFRSVGSLLVKIHTVRDWHQFLGGGDTEPDMEKMVDAVYISHRDMREAVRSIRDMGWGVQNTASEMAEANFCRRVRRRGRVRFFRREDYARGDTWVTVAKTEILCREAVIEAAGSKLQLDVKAEDLLTFGNRERLALLDEMSKGLDYDYSKAELELAAKELGRLRGGQCDHGFEVEMSVNPLTHLHKGHIRDGFDEEAQKGKRAIEDDPYCRAWLDRNLYDVYNV